MSRAGRTADRPTQTALNREEPDMFFELIAQTAAAFNAREELLFAAGEVQ
ncbi:MULTISPECIES: hypothetical protein [Actinomyces]|uniref:Uncharacterized protein n=1 Tax=Actinomyces respiraculi TaxID=2744574 RepID=A0A7T0LK70_9ACTO|nr:MULTISPECIES: hypothetical protein [Actinomyces]QPL05272.1 hypothetical protein ID810_11230 [Actinomyces respiraculi]